MKIFNYSDEYDNSEDDEVMIDYDLEDQRDIEEIIIMNNIIISNLKYYCKFNGINLLNKDVLDITSLIKL